MHTKKRIWANVVTKAVKSTFDEGILAESTFRHANSCESLGASDSEE